MKILGSIDKCYGTFVSKEDFIENPSLISPEGFGLYTLHGLVIDQEIQFIDLLNEFSDEFDGVVWFDK